MQNEKKVVLLKDSFEQRVVMHIHSFALTVQNWSKTNVG